MRHGRRFRYLDTDGRTLWAMERDRVRALVIPPAWQDVWVCPWPKGHIQAVGTHAAGRRHYLYHPYFREQQDTSTSSASPARCLACVNGSPRTSPGPG